MKLNVCAYSWPFERSTRTGITRPGSEWSDGQWNVVMFLKNSTSDVPVSQTVYRIEQVLLKCGVSGITKDYGNKADIIAIRFHLKLPARELTIRIPVDVDRCQQVLWMNYANGDQLSNDGQSIHWNNYKKKRRNDFREQAERTAWRIVQDCIEVQMSMIQTQQAETLEVFLPYV